MRGGVGQFQEARAQLRDRWCQMCPTSDEVTGDSWSRQWWEAVLGHYLRPMGDHGFTHCLLVLLTACWFYSLMFNLHRWLCPFFQRVQCNKFQLTGGHETKEKTVDFSIFVWVKRSVIIQLLRMGGQSINLNLDVNAVYQAVSKQENKPTLSI